MTIFKKVLGIISFLSITTVYASSDSTKLTQNYTNNWLKFLNSDVQYIDPCDGYRNRVKPYFEKSVQISNDIEPLMARKVINDYLLADMRYREEEDEFMKQKYPQWWEIANNNRDTRYYKTGNFNYHNYKFGSVGYPRLMNLGQKAARSLILDKPQGGYLTLTLMLKKEWHKELWLHNYVNYGYKDAQKVSYNNSRVMHHWEANGEDVWLTTETPRSYYRCPMEHPLWNTPKWDIMMDCAERGICSAQIHTNIR